MNYKFCSLPHFGSSSSAYPAARNSGRYVPQNVIQLKGLVTGKHPASGRLNPEALAATQVLLVPAIEH
jgi:hypothetical protein